MRSPLLSFQEAPSVLILGGPNGAGKSTAAEGLLPEIAGLANFFSLYLPLADSWRFPQNEGDQPLLVAHGR